MIVYTTENKLFITILITLIVNCAQDGLELECPSYKPYKTAVGCVAKCPTDFVKNGSSCIITCGSWFTNKNRGCQQECSENYFIKENLKAIGWYPYLEKECIDACPWSDLAFNQTCLEACPADYNYYVNNTCLQQCPDGFPYLMNITKKHIIHHKCLQTCPYLEDDNYCVVSCQGKMRLNSKCVKACPKSNQFVDGSHCRVQCPIERKFDANKTCVSKCPTDMSYIENNTCVSNCSGYAPYVETLSDGSALCVDSCKNDSRNQFILKNYCVAKCPNFTYNKTCLQQCPNSYSIIDNVTIGRNCQFGHMCTELFYYNACVDKCPNDKFLLFNENICVDMCPMNTVLKNRTCLRSCDGITPYSEETHINVNIWDVRYKFMNGHGRRLWVRISKQQLIFQCLNNCSNQTLKLNYTCVVGCPMEAELQDPIDVPWNLTSRYFRYGKTCVNQCPLEKRFIGIKFVENIVNPCYLHKCDAFTNYFVCMSVCPENTYVFKNMCLSHCPGFDFDVGNICVEKCPSIRRLKTVREVYIDSIVAKSTTVSMFQCVEACDTEFVSSNTCVNFCPANNPYTDRNICHNKTCGKKYEIQTAKGIVCVSECPNGTLINLNKCTTGCFNGTVMYNRSCLKTCPKSNPYKFETDMTIQDWKIRNNIGWVARNISVVGHMCQETCLSGQVVDSSLKCLNNCPIKETYLDGNFCHNKTCGNKFGNKTIKGIACLDVCPNETVHFMNTCVTQCPEKYKYILDSICVQECPSSKKFILNSSLNIFSLPSVFHELGTDKDLICLSECPYWTLQHGNICTANCPDDLEYEFESKCVNKCPSSSPLIVDTILDLVFSIDGQISKFKCLSNCGKNKLYKKDEKTCIFSFSCEHPYVEFDGQCLTHCPKGFNWFHGCFNVIAVVISTTCLSMILILCIYCCRDLFKEVYDFRNICRQHSKHDQTVSKPDKLLQFVDLQRENEALNDDVVCDAVSSDVCVDSLSLHLFNESHINYAQEEETNV